MSIQGTYNNGSDVRTAGYMPVIGQKKPESTLSFKDSLNDVATAKTAETAPAENAVDGEEHGFMAFLKGVLDVINPLQHIPVISTIYRHLTGDEISPMARIAGDTLFGGPIGAAMGVVNVAMEKSTGKDIGDTMLAMVTGDKNEQTATMVASNLNDIAPAASSDNIIWNEIDAPTVVASADAQTKFPQPLPPAHPPVRAGASGYKPAYLSYKDASPVLPPKGGLSDNAFLTAAEKGAREEIASSRSDALSSLHPQEAPATDAGTEMSPELIANAQQRILDTQKNMPKEMIAYKMMEALDKYGAMKKAGI